MNKFQKYLIFIVPSLYLLLGLYYRQIFGELSLRSTDPEYIQFLSGMCVATGQFSQANIDHPGSALQLLLALVFKIVYLFRNQNYPFFEDAIINSDLYLAVGNLTVTLVIAAAMIWAGYKILKITNNIFYVIMIQCSPLLWNIWYEIFGRIYPELLFIVPVLILQVQLLNFTYKDTDECFVSDSLVYAFAIALGMSLKMTFLPFICIPLFVLHPFKRKIQFLIATAVSFLIIALPVTFQLKKFWFWMKGMFMHSGAYHSGTENIIDKDLFIQNFKAIISSEKTFFIVLSVYIISALAFYFLKKRGNTKWNKIARINSGILLTVFLIILMVSKHLAERYFIPLLLFFPFFLILIMEIIQYHTSHKFIRIGINILASVFILLLLYKELPYTRLVSESVENQMQARKSTRSFISTLPKDAYTFVVSQDYGCPYHEYAIMYSFCVAGGGWPNYKEKLDEIFPNIYFYFTWDNTLKYWAKDFDLKTIINSAKPVFLYLEQNNEDLYNKMAQKLKEFNPEVEVEKELIFENKVNKEGILRLGLSFRKDSLEKNELKSIEK